VEHESVVVGYFDFGGNSSVDNHLPFGFMDYYLACLLMIQNSFNTKTFRFAVVTNSNMASLLSLSSPLTIISIRGRQLDVVSHLIRELKQIYNMIVIARLEQKFTLVSHFHITFN
jgi:hypothetical protein